MPLIFVNTQKIFGETLAYRDELAERLGFVDLRVFRPDPYRLALKDQTSLRWSYDPDGCCDLRKVEPLRRALAPFDAWISGRKAFQGKTRNALPRFEEDEGRLKINPLADWDKARLDAYFDGTQAAAPSARGERLPFGRLRAVHFESTPRRRSRAPGAGAAGTRASAASIAARKRMIRSF